MSSDNERTVVGLDFLPEALVKEMLNRYKYVINSINDQLSNITKAKNELKNYLLEKGLLSRTGELIHQNRYPTTVGIDGSWTVIKQLALDTIAIAAVAVEGLIPPREDRYWDKPHHIVNIYPVKHHPKTSTLCKALMFSYELELAIKAPHNVVYLDGSLTTHLIAFGQAFAAIKEGGDENEELPYELKYELINRIDSILDNYLEVLSSPRMDKLYIGIPKYSSRREIIEEMMENSRFSSNYQDLQEWNDKGLMTFLLDADEIIRPISLTTNKDRWHLSGLDEQYKDRIEEIVDALNNLHVMYYKPTAMHPALRIEMSNNIAKSDAKLSLLLESLQNQSRNLGIIEPYPLYIADNFVKQIFPSLLQLKDLTLSEISTSNGMRFHDIFLSLHEYRSEGGLE